MPNTEPVRLFGTDGIRGTAGQAPLDVTTVRRVGGAIVRALTSSAAVRMLIGRDTRESGGWIERELTAGAVAEGASVASAGVVPTPAVAFLTREGFDVGVMVSASHNPFEDNGIKVFAGGGEKFTEDTERRVERLVAADTLRTVSAPVEPEPRADLLDRYVDHLRTVIADARMPSALSMAVDCANGATGTVARRLFDSLGLRVALMGDRPDGRNINLQSGSTNPERLARLVVEQGHPIGVAFDGDGDRAIFADHTGRIVNGDAVLYLSARQLQSEGRLRGNAIVATVMSNIGLELALRDLGIGLVRCAVGDKYVMEEMASRGLSLGGEQSGHVIFSDYLFTGDGLCTALNVLRTMAITGRSLAELVAGLVTYPQVLVNVRVKQRIEVRNVPALAATIARVESLVAGEGRLLVRYSGTEPLLRIMIEGRDESQIRAWAGEIAQTATNLLS
jgi:phosphoglucosamine mutase